MIDDRKKLILKAIVDDYISTAEPVGSRTLEKKYNLGLSSATIRNEMSDLEELGLLTQPHTSSGRVPSLAGYRMYVDELMSQYRLTMEEIGVLQSVMEDKIDFLDKIIARTSGIMSQLTNYTSVAVGPKMMYNSIKSIRLISVSDKVVLTIIITNEGIVKDKKIILTKPVTPEELGRLENAINNNLTGINFTDIQMDNIVKLVNEARASDELVLAVLKFVQDSIEVVNESDIYVNGQANIFNFPEYSNVEKAKKFLDLTSNRADIFDIISNATDKDKKIVVKIGEKGSPIEDCSLIVSRYKVSDNMEGFIGLIGPTRMDYRKAVTVMDYVTDIINNKMKQITEKKEE